ncbi:MAG: sulfurtransferase [Desulfovibrionaceae bacterium]|nr:sulfurtransferase [Desulfovibrionaceae bacterium]MBF0514872.1 sulfurtransferase [Desulfovibrionaceae bacterium]
MPESEGRKSANPVPMAPEEAALFMSRRKQGAYTLLDVRQDWEYEEFHLPGARHVPLPDLADRLGEIPRNAPVITYCRSGKRSAAAAGLLSGQGFAPVFELDGGIEAWNGQVATGSRDTGMLAFPESPSPPAVLALAYGMEDVLGAQYLRLAEQCPDPAVAETLTTLAGFEDKHKTLIRILFEKLGPGHESLETLAGRFPPVMESGRSLDDYMRESGGNLTAPADVLQLAMQIEAQALDLYMRYAEAPGPGEARDIFLRLAREEKGHLKALGNLLTRERG